MRKRIAKRAADTAGATFTRFVGGLLALLLALQVAGLPHSGARVAAPSDARTIALATLGAAVGQPVALCAHGGDPSHPNDPANSGGCEHCIFCHSVATGIAAAPVAAIAVARFANPAVVERPREDIAFARARYRGGATPRGPPLLG